MILKQIAKPVSSSQAIWMESKDKKTLLAYQDPDSDFQSEMTRIKFNAVRSMQEFNAWWYDFGLGLLNALGSALVSAQSLFSITVCFTMGVSFQAFYRLYLSNTQAVKYIHRKMIK